MTFVLSSPGGEQLGIDEDLRIVRLVLAGDVDHQQAARHADLNRRQSDAGRIIHGLDHVLDKAREFLVDALHRLALLAQNRVGQIDDRLDAHGVEIITDTPVVNRPAPDSRCNRGNMFPF